MFDRCLPAPTGFEWRVQTGRWRWIILGALGVAGCGGRSSGPDAEGSEAGLQGAAAGSASVPEVGAGGDSGGPTFYGNGGAQTVGTGSGGSASTATPCEAPFTDLGGGWEQCGNGMVHRAALGSCTPSPLPRPDAPRSYHDTGVDAGYYGECRRDTDCTAKRYGHCEPGYDIDTYCAYGCVSNADCDPGYSCFCGEPFGACRPASCTTDADCGDGLLCSDFTMDPGCGGQAFACQTAADTCATPSDCGGAFCTRGTFGISVQPGAPSFCTDAQCVIGRPFLVAGAERLAPAAARCDWYPQQGSARAAAPLGPALREAVHRGWLDQALMEHASVAAFARFSLQLLALGAPAELCEQAASAMRDEIAHARACFELARRHSDGDVGPGPLDLTGALDAIDLEAIVLGTIAEGCIGETVAAIEAAEALAHCEDEATRATLARIARDETRHAELAWQFVAWALESGPATLRERAREAFVAALRETDAADIAPSPLDRELARHGLIAPSVRGELRRRVLSTVIAPCAFALLDMPRPASKNANSAAAAWPPA